MAYPHHGSTELDYQVQSEKTGVMQFVTLSLNSLIQTGCFSDKKDHVTTFIAKLLEQQFYVWKKPEALNLTFER